MRREPLWEKKMDKNPTASDVISGLPGNTGDETMHDDEALDITLPKDSTKDTDRTQCVPALPTAKDIDDYFNDQVGSMFNDSGTEKPREQRLSGEILRCLGDQEYCRRCGELLRQFGDDFNENVLNVHVCEEIIRRRRMQLEEELELEQIENTSIDFS